MHEAAAKPKPTWTSAYTGILFAMVACIYLQIAPKHVAQVDLAFLKPIGQLLFIALLPAITFLHRLDAGTMTRGLLVLALAFYTLVGAFIGITVYEDWPQVVTAFNTLAGR